jgi:hypothetical protein
MNNDDERDTAEEAYNRALLHDPDEARGELVDNRTDEERARVRELLDRGLTVAEIRASGLAAFDEDDEPPEPAPRVPDGGPRRAFEYSESERRDIRDAGRGHLL